MKFNWNEIKISQLIDWCVWIFVVFGLLPLAQSRWDCEVQIKASYLEAIGLENVTWTEFQTMTKEEVLNRTFGNFNRQNFSMITIDAENQNIMKEFER